MAASKAAKRKRVGLSLGSAAEADTMTAAEAVAAINQTPAKARRHGPPPDPAKRALRSFLFRLKPEHASALKRAAGQRVADGLSKRFDSGEVLRLVLDAWIAKGSKVP